MLAGDLPYAAPPYKPPLPAWLDSLILNAPKGFLVAFLSLALLLGVPRTLKKHAAVPLALLMGAIPFFILIWHADAQEVARHSISAAILLRLSIWLLLLYLVDAAVQKFIFIRGNESA